MRFVVLTLFKDLIEQCMNASITGRALDSGIIRLDTIDIRDFSGNKHNRVDDYPYGGGAGMVMEAGPVYRACEAAKELLGNSTPRVIYLTPQGRVFDQAMAQELAQEKELVFLCGHYEG
ncbi:MAG: tRNA (guanosine(37)-N1)-methyltransferase TrmD, partial [Lachnospiraceae bacterium]|nr:tRNA (guanosine(37)-N1)-methyltransferase TrmD [Lachnospiraceae bacterium]